MAKKNEKRLVSFRTLKEVCKYIAVEFGVEQILCEQTELDCNAANCPVWRRAERKEGEE